MKKNDLQQKVYENSILDLTRSKIAVFHVVNALHHALSTADTVTLKGFGTLRVVRTNEKKLIHVRTKKEILVPIKNKIVFTPCVTLLQALNAHVDTHTALIAQSRAIAPAAPTTEKKVAKKKHLKGAKATKNFTAAKILTVIDMSFEQLPPTPPTP